MPGFLPEFLESNPVALMFLVIGLGYLLGKLKIVGFELGSVSGVLFVGLFFGHFGYELSSTVQTMGFVLFIFSVGLQAGPRFFGVLRIDGLRYFALAVVISATGFLVALTLSKLFGFELGAAAGLLSGGLTSSPTLAAAQEAVRAGHVPVPGGTTAAQVMTNVTTAYAITYIFGLVGLILIIRLLPRLAGIDLPAEAGRLAAEQTDGLADEAEEAPHIVTRAYRITKDIFTGVPLRELKVRLPARASVERLRRDGEFVEIGPDTEFRIGDEVSLVGYLDRLADAPDRIGVEIVDDELLAERTESARIVVTSKAHCIETSPRDLVLQYGCFVAKVQRSGVDMPLKEGRLEAGDVLHVTGSRRRIDELGRKLGHIERAVDETDLVTFGLGITAGVFLGGLSVSVAGISIGVGSAGGLLIAGLVIGYLRALKPTFGRVPTAARWVFMELGLLTFMAGVGLRAGTTILETLVSSGPTLFVAGILVTTLPLIVGFLFGRRVLGLNPVVLLGGITGSMTSGAALSIVNREAGNTMPALGYAGAYAFANVLLTIAGSIILLL